MNFNVLDLLEYDKVRSWIKDKRVDSGWNTGPTEGTVYLFERTSAYEKRRDHLRRSPDDEVVRRQYKKTELKVHLLKKSELGRITWTNFCCGEKLYTIKGYTSRYDLHRKCRELGWIEAEPRDFWSVVMNKEGR
ncbi:hypothetical protein C0992_001167 [Termitomyces sp. T32_za158]|nr:hypothetical protein C0992_001167 [Termitomyces sp. T32_za158]